MPNAFQELKNRIFDSRKIYEGRGGYNYKLPPWDLQKFLEGFLTGRTVKYTEDELDRVRNDITNLAIDLLQGNPEKESKKYRPEIMIAVGAPGSGKTVLLKGLKEKLDNEGRKIVYLEPYEVCLPALKTTFQEDLEASDGSEQSRKAVYQKWRPAALGAFHLLAAHMIRKKYSLLLCSKTSDSKYEEMFALYRKQNYYVTLLHLSAPPDLCRFNMTRPSLFYTAGEIPNGFLIAAQAVDLLAHSYLNNADKIEFYYRDNADHAPILAYTITLTSNEEARGITLIKAQVSDHAALNKIGLIHDNLFDIRENPEKGFRKIIANRLVRSIPTYEELNF